MYKSEQVRLTPVEWKKLFSIVKLDPKKQEKYPNKPWLWYKNISDAATALGISRPKVYRALAEYPYGLPSERAPRKAQPKYVEDFTQTLIYQKILQDYTDPKTGQLTGHGQRLISVSLTLYRLSREKYGNYVDPASADIEFFRWAWKHPEFRDSKTGTTEFNKAVAIRIIMRYAGIDPNAYKEFETKGLKRTPQKKTWYLNEDELIRFIYGIQEIDTLVYVRLAFEAGARFSSAILTTTDKIAWEHNLILMYEPKVDKVEERYFSDSTMEFLRMYIRDFNIVGRLFRWGTGKTTYNEARQRLFRAGLNAGLFRIVGKDPKTKRPIYEGKPTSTHLLKHTFVSLASLHGWGLDDVSEQTGTDPSTLKQYYLGVGKDKIKALIIGKYNYVPWHEWINKTLHPHWVARYNQLKPLMVQKDGLVMQQ